MIQRNHQFFISADLRQIALVIILTRAGLALDLSDLKKVGRPAILMCFVPACIEMLGTILIAPVLFGITHLEAAIMGSVLAAVSPAVIVPRMIRLIEEEYGTDKGIPELLLAGASVDDVFVIVMFTAFTSLASTGELSAISFSFLLIELQNRLERIIPISGLLAIMSLGIVMKKSYPVLAHRLSGKYNKLWVAAEVFLFVLVGATVDLRYAVSAGVNAVLLVLAALLFRMLGVALSLIKTKLNRKERLFCMLAYLPKATVQAAIGAIPLSMGLACGQIVLTVAVLSILITAPLGAVCVDNLYTRLLHKADG
ncbi:MAG: cation:proton antiporter [Lachnospiraceae bacterium]